MISRSSTSWRALGVALTAVMVVKIIPEHELEEFAFSRCAIEEILQLIWDHPWTLASDIIEDFVLKMEFYKVKIIPAMPMPVRSSGLCFFRIFGTSLRAFTKVCLFTMLLLSNVFFFWGGRPR